jgi:hypothetical protein
MRALVTQSNYIPWKGYFDNMSLSDVFVTYDSVQFTKRDWRNRNQIKTPNGLAWLTIPVQVKGKFEQSVRETRVSDLDWSRKHLDSLRTNYRQAAGYSEMKDWLEALYRNCNSEWLSEINRYFLNEIASFLQIDIEFHSDTEFMISGDRTERLVSICKSLSATEYLTGPAAKNYMDEGKFLSEGIKINYSEYDGYPAYDQIHGEFTHQVSILDLILNTGSKAPNYLKYTKKFS